MKRPKFPAGNPPGHASLAAMTDTSRYSPALLAAARTLAERGALDRDLAVAFGVSFQTIRGWKQRHPDFAAACRLPPDAAAEAVERALFRKATGYDREAERVVLKDGQLVRTTVTEHVPPCDKAAIHWLRVRRPDRWGPPPPVIRSAAGTLSPTEEALREIEGDAYEAYCAAQDGEPAIDGDDDALARIDALDPGPATPADDTDPLQTLETASTPSSSQRKPGSLSTVSRSHLESDPSIRWDDAQERDTLPHRYQVPLPALREAIPTEPIDADPPATTPHYDPAIIPLARQLAEQGALDRDLARAFDVTPTTLRQWTLRHAAFGAAVRLGKAAADDAVENALFARATGYSYLRERIFLTDDGDLLRTDTLVEQPPSLRAALFWLTRRRTDRWSRHRQRPDLDPADAARLFAQTRARVTELDLHRRHWRTHGCAPPGRAEPEPPDEFWSPDDLPGEEER